jgi:hypothetical protein
MADEDVASLAGEEGESLIVNLNDEEEKPAAGEKAAAAKPPPVPGPSAAPTPQTGLADLQRQIQAERNERARVIDENRRLAAERDQAVYFAQEAERRGVSTYELYNENQIKGTQDQMEALAAQAEQAMTDGDFKRATTLNLKIGRLGGALAVLERDQAVLVQQREQMQREQRQPQQRQPQQPRQQAEAPTDPLERAIMNRTEPTKEFLRKHPELVRGDGTLKASAVAAHERARDEGYQVDTPAYFDFIERSLQAQIPGGGGNPPPSSLRGAPTVAAPVARGASPGGGGGGYSGNGTFTMTPKMRRLAAEQNVPEKEWAQNYVRLLAEGRITPIT